MAKHNLFILSKRALIAASCCMATIATSGWVLHKIYPLNVSRYHDCSTVIYTDQQEIGHVFLTHDEKYRIRTDYADVPALYIETLIKREDKHFWRHGGINPFSIVRAFFQNARAGYVVSGGSTLTMQTARLLNPQPRSLTTKIIEAWRAMQLEWMFSKKEILSIYLTLAPFGGNIEGVKAASRYYFHKPPASLTPSEIALLVAMVQSPYRHHPIRFPENAKKARSKILDLMELNRVHQDAPLPIQSYSFEHHFWHYAWRLKREQPEEVEIQTTIQLSLQQGIENILKQYQSFLPPKANAAILLYDHQENKILAYLGAIDPFDTTRNGFVDYVTAYRSPGSTLKPFIYGMAFDTGLFHPDSVLWDVRRRFGAYYPRNFDKESHGSVRAKEALALSLNIPAVSLLNEMGVVRFFSALKNSGIEPKWPSSGTPGLSGALGGLGMTLEQLVLLYAQLGQGEKGKLFSERAAYYVAQSLRVETSNHGQLSVKTGTSYGHRDALALGWNDRYVIGVWIGLPNGAPMRQVTGATLAVPLVHKVHSLLPPVESLRKESRFQESIVERVQEHDPLMLLFPVHNSAISFEFNAQAIPCTLRGGIRPYTWWVDDKPVGLQLWQSTFHWVPTSKGYYVITVVDATGKSVRATVELT